MLYIAPYVRVDLSNQRLLSIEVSFYYSYLSFISNLIIVVIIKLILIGAADGWYNLLFQTICGQVLFASYLQVIDVA